MRIVYRHWVCQLGKSDQDERPYGEKQHQPIFRLETSDGLEVQPSCSTGSGQSRSSSLLVGDIHTIAL